MDLDEFAGIVTSHPRVREVETGGRRRWQSGGRLVARELGPTSVVIRSTFETRDDLVSRFPGTFSVPARFARHMMVVADLARGDADAIEDAVAAACDLQSHPG